MCREESSSLNHKQLKYAETGEGEENRKETMKEDQ